MVSINLKLHCNKDSFVSTYQLAILIVVLYFSSIATTQAKAPNGVKFSVDRDENIKLRESLILPYAFSSEDLGTVAGVAAMATSVYQQQMTMGGTVFGGSETKGFALALWDYRVLDSERLFFSTIGMNGEYPLLRAYSPLPGVYTPLPRSGSNDSSVDDFIESAGSSSWWEFKLEYVLPLGNAKEQSMARYQLAGGLLKGELQIPDWNPLETGTSVLIARQFNRDQVFRNDEGEIEGSVHGIELGLLYDNTDFPTNPSQGSSQYLAINYTPKWLGSENQWSFIEFEASKYFSLGETSFAKQNILAFNAWAGYSPSWEVLYDENGKSKVINGAPSVEGAKLGGMYRLRGFRQDRFHDKAVIYATAEYRMTLDYNPIADVRWLNFLSLDWFQTVLYVEGGRVSPTFHRDTLLSDWKSDVGVSIRALAAGVLVRVDFTTSSEGSSTWFMVGHPF